MMVCWGRSQFVATNPLRLLEARAIPTVQGDAQCVCSSFYRFPLTSQCVTVQIYAASQIGRTGGSVH